MRKFVSLVVFVLITTNLYSQTIDGSNSEGIVLQASTGKYAGNVVGINKESGIIENFNVTVVIGEEVIVKLPTGDKRYIVVNKINDMGNNWMTVTDVTQSNDIQWR